MSKEINPILQVDPEDLIPIETIEDNPIAFFTDASRVDKILSMINRYADESYLGLMSTNGDMTVASNRQKFISLATKIRSAKVTLRKLGEDTAREARKLPNTINGVYKPAVETLNELEAKMRLPVTEWEEIQKEYEEKAEAIIKQMHEIPNKLHQAYLAGDYSIVDAIQEAIDKLQAEADANSIPDVIIKLEKEEDYLATITNTVFQLMGVLAQCKELEAKRIREQEEAKQREEEERKKEEERQNQLAEEARKRKEAEAMLEQERKAKAEEIRKAEEAAKLKAYQEKVLELKETAKNVLEHFSAINSEYLLDEESSYYTEMVSVIERDVNNGTKVGKGRFSLPIEIITLKQVGAYKIFNYAEDESTESDSAKLVEHIAYYVDAYGNDVPELVKVKKFIDLANDVNKELKSLIVRLEEAKGKQALRLQEEEEKKAKEKEELEKQIKLKAVKSYAMAELETLLGCVYKDTPSNSTYAETFIKTLKELPEDSHVSWLLKEVL